MPDQPTWPEAVGASGVAIGDRIAGRYRLEAPIAAGGMAQVWRAVDEVLARPVAVKVLHPHLADDPAFVARFRREAVAAARLAHPSIVAIYDTHREPESIVMELVEGRTLRDELDQRTFLGTDEALQVAAGIAEALDVAHRAGIIHRDVKPSNVILSAEGAIKVTDFGIAKAARDHDDPALPDLTVVGQLVGTAKYLAPEQVDGGTVDPRTDLYALGIVLYEMLCGRPPFDEGNDQATATARLKGPPPRPRSVLRTIPAPIDRLVMKSLSRQPESRVASAAAFRAQLLDLVDTDEDYVDEQAPIDEEPETAASFARSERGRLVPTVLLVLVSAALGVAWMLLGGTEARRDLIDFVDAVTPGRIDDSGSGRAVTNPPLAARAFDPFGDNREHDNLAALAVDGDDATAWRTERYTTRNLGGLKPGVGLIVSTDVLHTLEELAVTSPSRGWSATIYVSAQRHDSLAGWGEPVASRSDIGRGTTRFDLDATVAQHVLIWITDLGDEVGVLTEIADAAISAAA